MNTNIATMTTLDLLEWANSIDPSLTFRIVTDDIHGEVVCIGDTCIARSAAGIWLEAGRRFSEHAVGGPGPAIGFTAKRGGACESGYCRTLEKLRRRIELVALRYELIDKQARLF